MKRGGPLKRGTSSLKRSPLKRGRKKTYKTHEERDAMVRELVKDRGAKCERCGCPILIPSRFNDHHYVPKRKPYNGPDDLSNRKLLCMTWDKTRRHPGKIEQGCHEWVEGHPDQARKEGYLCPKRIEYIGT